MRIEPGHVEPTAKRVRARIGGEWVVDSRRAALVWEHSRYPQFGVPPEDVAGELVPSGSSRPHDVLGDGEVLDLVTPGGVTVESFATRYPATPIERLRGLVRPRWSAAEAWFEEDVEVIVHPRSPYTRVDALESARHVVVEVDGTVVADSVRPVVLFETGLPPRWYVPATDVRWEHLDPTETTSSCPYKGRARWWDVVVDDERHADLAWCYPTPLPESAPIAGFVAFYDERVDLVVDGERRAA